MLFKKVFLLHLLPIVIATFVFLSLKNKIDFFHSSQYPVSLRSEAATSAIDHFYYNDLSKQVVFSEALFSGVPVMIGSSELSARHLTGLASSYFVKVQRSRFLALGHAGFQSLAILSVLAANRELLKDAKLTIMVSPGWFEKQYAKGTSLPSFFDYCPPNYIYQLLNDEKLDQDTRRYIFNYIRANYEKINAPNALIRLAGKDQENTITKTVYAPFHHLSVICGDYLAERDSYLKSQQIVVRDLLQHKSGQYVFCCRPENWDSLFAASKKTFAGISTNNDIAVENKYYEKWLKGKHKKTIEAVNETDNQELKDFMALLRFLKAEGCKPIFVIMPLNKKAHRNLEALEPTIAAINRLLSEGGLKVFDMFSPNLKNYEDGVLEDIMHPYDYGWYQIDRFIMDNYCQRYD